MWGRVCVVCLAVSASISVWGGMRGSDSSYVVFWNVENYFDPFDDSLTLDDEFTPSGYRHWTWKKFLEKRNLMAKTLMSMYDRLFSEYNQSVGQILLTGDDVEIENRAQHLSNTFSALLEMGMIPIVNENDSVSSAEIEDATHKVLGDNDRLSALVAKLCHADPAIMAAPLITTIVDAISLVVYFQIASALLPI